MKNIFTLLFITITSFSFTQSRDAIDYERIELAGLTYKSSYNVFSEEDRNQYILEDFVKLKSGYSWGNFISFTEKSFHTYYSAPCGNDCFTSVDGTYKFVGENRIQVFVETINRSGFCQLKSEEPQKSFGIYEIKLTKSGLTLTKE